MEKIVVVGGGIVGASAAYELACRGVGVTLVDREDQGYATQAGAGIVSGVTARESRAAYAALTHPALAHYPGLVSRMAEDGVADSGFSWTHGLLVAQPDEQESLRGAFKRVVDEWSGDPKRAGSFELLAPGDPRRLFPAIDERLSAIHIRHAARVDGRAFRAGLRTALRSRGGEVVSGDATLLIEKGRARGVQVGETRIWGDAVVLCTGAWAPELVREQLPHLGVAPQRGQIIHLAVPGQEPGGWPFIVGYHSHYLLPFADRVVVGATRETGAGFDYRFTAAGVARGAVGGPSHRAGPGDGDGARDANRFPAAERRPAARPGTRARDRGAGAGDRYRAFGPHHRPLLRRRRRRARARRAAAARPLSLRPCPGRGGRLRREGDQQRAA